MGRTILRLVSPAAIALAALSLAGCGSDAKLTDRTVHMAVPLSGPLAQRGQDMAHAAALAFKDGHHDTDGSRLSLEVVDSAKQLGAKDAAGDPKAIAFVGGLSSTAVDRATKAQRNDSLLDVALAPAPTNATNAAARTGNVIWQLPSAPGQGDALAQYVAAHGQTEIGFFNDGSAFSDSVQRGFDAGIARAGIKQVDLARIAKGVPVTGAGSDKGFVEADDPSNAAPANPHTMITSGMTADAYPPAGERFYERFKDEYGHEPDRFAIYAYEAVGLVIDAVNRAEDAGKEATPANVTNAAFGIRNRFGPVGHYDVLPSGRTTLYIFQARGGDAPTGPASLIEALR